ncbi:MAG: hypothetical protein ABIJ45_02005, partial [Candidatus Zixiibacteriota bacterium]
MKHLKSQVVLLAFVLLLGIAAVNAEDDGPWFDMANCDFCVNLTTDPSLLPSMTWEHFILDNGMMTVTTYKPEVAESYGKCMTMMEEVGKKMEKGEAVKMCNYCKGYGALMQAGVKFEYHSFTNGDVMLATSNDPVVIEQIHKFAHKTMDEYAKMSQM